jgi:hypothetical protein
MTTTTNIKDKKMKLKVYHTKSWALNSLLHFKTDGFKPHKDDYQLVAEVECDNFGDVFYLTNHVHQEWWKNEGVTLIKESRSTSVGDIVVDENDNIHLCASMGWKETMWNEKPKSDDIWWKKNNERFAALRAEGI